MVLYNGMASTSPCAALYFVALMTFGNYVLFNLLVAILVEGFQAEVRRGYRSWFDRPIDLLTSPPWWKLTLQCTALDTLQIRKNQMGSKSMFLLCFPSSNTLPCPSYPFLHCLSFSVINFLLLSPKQGDANRSYSDDDRSSCNFEENDKQKDSLHLSGMKSH